MSLVLPDREPTETENALISATRDLRVAELDIAKLHAERARVENEAFTEALVEQRLALEYTKAGNDRNRTFDYVAQVNSKTVEGALDVISRWHRMNHEPIKLRFTSPGGDPISGLVLFDSLSALRAEGTPVVTIVLGMAASMAAVLLQAGTERVVGPKSWILIHDASFQVEGKLRDVEEHTKFVDRMNDSLMSILADRATVTKSEIARKAKKGDWWLNANDCIKFGFADRIGFS